MLALEQQLLGVLIDGQELVYLKDIPTHLDSVKLEISKLIGNLDTLNTIQKQNLVAAINENKAGYTEIKNLIDSGQVGSGNANIFTSNEVPLDTQFLLFKLFGTLENVEDYLSSDVKSSLILHKDDLGVTHHILPYTIAENIIYDKAGKIRLKTKVETMDSDITELKSKTSTFNTDIINLKTKSIKKSGSSTFNSTEGIVITHNLNTSNYNVTITPTSNPNGQLGEVWVVKDLNNMTVFCSGTTKVTTFDYIIS